MRLKFLSIAAASAMLATSAQAISYEYQQLYKDPKVMGMGGANVASGGSYSAIFSNPAGLTRIPKEYGWEFQFTNIAIAANENIQDLQDLLNDADDEAKVAKEIAKMIGEHYNAGVGVVPVSIAKMFDETAFAFGAVASANVSVTAHQGFGAEGILETNVFAAGGAAGGVAHDFNGLTIGSLALNRLTVGVGAKYLKYGSFSRGFTAADIANDEFDNIKDELEEGTAFVADLGVIYDIFPNLSVGLSALNIGGIGDDDKRNMQIPMTINAGVSYSYRIDGQSFFNQFRVAADYIDISEEYGDSSKLKRLRAGVDVNVWDGWFSTMALQAGVYGGEWTAGANLRLAMVDLAVSSYAEEVGAYAGQDSDRRYMASFGVSW